VKTTFDSVDLRHIDLSDTTFKITTGASSDNLIDSIRNVGLISPPIIARKPGGGYTVVCGFRRIAACAFLGWLRIDARIIESSENETNCLLLAIADNTHTRLLNVIEQAAAVSKLAVYSSDDIALSREARKASLSVNPGLIKKLKKIDTVPAALKEKIAADIISLTIGLELAKLESAAVMAFVRIIEALKLTLSHQKEMIQRVKEIAKINEMPIADFVDQVIVDKIINDPELDRNQKIKKMRHTLKQMRYPEIVCFEKKYSNHLQQIQLPDSVHLVPPTDFEGSHYAMQLNFQDLPQFKTIVETLNQLQDHPDFAKILDKNFEDN
jgi:ParB/RepB/Spo0J family partition protein